MWIYPLAIPWFNSVAILNLFTYKIEWTPILENVIETDLSPVKLSPGFHSTHFKRIKTKKTTTLKKILMTVTSPFSP